MENASKDAAIAKNLAVWFGRAARDLPWRRTRDPYRIWLSEVMLQQTRVDTVIPYYERFLARFPDARALAEAPLDDVLALWSGLGYYSRARSLHQAAKQLVDEHAGVFPSSAEALRALRGVGPYTAGAIASIAFDAREPLVDGNVGRVLSRAYGVSLDARGTEAQKVFWETATRLVNAEADVPPSVLNQALMELGALVCSPTKPGCGVCPLAKLCVAHRDGLTEVLPVMSARAKPKPVAMVAAVAWRGGRVLLAQRSAQGLFGGMWEPPLVEAASVAEARIALRGLRARRGGAAARGEGASASCAVAPIALGARGARAFAVGGGCVAFRGPGAVRPRRARGSGGGPRRRLLACGRRSSRRPPTRRPLSC